MRNTWGFELHKNNKSWIFETIDCSLYSDMYICHFYVDQTPNYFVLKIYTVVLYIIENMHNFFLDFFETFKYVFSMFQNCRITGAWEHEISTLRLSHNSLLYMQLMTSSKILKQFISQTDDITLFRHAPVPPLMHH